MEEKSYLLHGVQRAEREGPERRAGEETSPRSMARELLPSSSCASLFSITSHNGIKLGSHKRTNQSTGEVSVLMIQHCPSPTSELCCQQWGRSLIHDHLGDLFIYLFTGDGAQGIMLARRVFYHEVVPLGNFVLF